MGSSENQSGSLAQEQRTRGHVPGASKPFKRHLPHIPPSFASALTQLTYKYCVLYKPTLKNGKVVFLLQQALSVTLKQDLEEVEDVFSAGGFVPVSGSSQLYGAVDYTGSFPGVFI